MVAGNTQAYFFGSYRLKLIESLRLARCSISYYRLDKVNGIDASAAIPFFLIDFANGLHC
jgi:hypothetical protein